MIQAYMGDMLLLGVTRGNIERLTAGKPIHVQVVGHAIVRRVGILFGEDKPAILKQLEEAGVEIAQAMKDSVAAEPL